jgi:hypothetical protein
VHICPPVNLCPHLIIIKKYFTTCLVVMMKSSSSHYQSSTNVNGNSIFKCATGVFCKLPSVKFTNSPHKCRFHQCMLHGVCGILHDPDKIMYQNRCNYCDPKYNMSQHQLPPHQAVFPSPIPATIFTHTYTYQPTL